MLSDAFPSLDQFLSEILFKNYYSFCLSFFKYLVNIIIVQQVSRFF